jgi:signal transduction histidine kinase
VLEVDRQLLGVALVNLIVNACEAMAEARGRESRLAISIDVGPAPELTRAVRVDRETGERSSLGGGPPSLASGSLRETTSWSSLASGSLRETCGLLSSASLPSCELRIGVGDTGLGVPEEIRDRIFDPFFTTRASGSGIGLANVQKIVHAHGGSLSLQSSELGSVFRIHLPLPADTA